MALKLRYDAVALGLELAGSEFDALLRLSGVNIAISSINLQGALEVFP